MSVSDQQYPRGDAAHNTSIRRVLMPVLPRLQIPLRLWTEMMAYVLACPVEVNGFGRVSVGNGVVFVEEIFVIEQDASLHGCTTDPVALSRFMHQMSQTGGRPGDIKFQWHSHVNGDARLSEVDYDNIDRWPGDCLFSLVLNRAGGYEARVDQKRPLQYGDYLTVEVIVDTPLEQWERVCKDLTQKVTGPSGRKLWLRAAPVRPVSPTPLPHALDPGSIAVQGGDSDVAPEA